MDPTLKSRSALVLRSNDTDLMPPPAKRIKRPKNVIDEESYTSALSEIIARDFFPGLLETETQHEYLDALESQNDAWISSAGRRLEHLMTPGRKQGRRGTSMKTSLQVPDTPRAFIGDTPRSVDSRTSASTNAHKERQIDTNLSLDSFQAKYTSEDNESFYKLLDTQNQKRADKYAWMWSGNHKMPSKMMLKQKEVEARLLQSRESLLDDGGKKDRLAIRDVSEKPAMPDSWKSKPKNGLMFAPESVEDSVESIVQRAQNDSRAGPKGVAYSNTRMPMLSEPVESSNIPPSPSLSAVRNALAGKYVILESESGGDGTQTPRVNGYAFVDDEPEIEPEAEPAPRTIDLGKGDIAKNPFIIKAQSKREDLHHRLVDKHARIKRESLKNGAQGKSDSTPIPRFPSSPRVGGGQLSPAAQHLWSRVGSNTQSISAFGAKNTQTPRAGSGLRARWTPSGG